MNAPAHPPYYTILGIDPGKTNTAYSVVRIKLAPFRYKILAHGMIKNSVNDLTGAGVAKRVGRFKTEVRKLKRIYKVDAAFAERFMTRGASSQGTTIEVVSFMLCALLHLGIKHVQFVTAAQWKNQWNRHNDLKAYYKQLHPMPPHPIDATSIAIYGASQVFPEEIPCFQALDNIKDFTQQLLAANKEPVNETRNNRSKNKGSAAPRCTTRTRKARTPQAPKHAVKAMRGSKRKGSQTKRKATRGSRKAPAKARVSRKA